MKAMSISSKSAMEYILPRHYSGRVVGSRYSFGWFNPLLSGAAMYSQPASYTLCKGVCGPAYRFFVLELSRLVIGENEARCSASGLIGQSLRQLPASIVVSYADCNDDIGHIGYVYQATNWLYTGQGNAEPYWYHPHTGELISKTRRHIDRKAAAIGLHWKELVKSKAVGKHRYVTFTGPRWFKKAAREALRYPVKEYPKGETRRH